MGLESEAGYILLSSFVFSVHTQYLPASQGRKERRLSKLQSLVAVKVLALIQKILTVQESFLYMCELFKCKLQCNKTNQIFPGC